MEAILRIEEVTKRYPAPGGGGSILTLDRVSLSLSTGTAFGLVGESGAGKSTLARLIIGLERPSSGRIWFDGREVTALNRRERQALKRFIQMVWQDPAGALNPYLTVGELIAEPLEIFHLGDRTARRRRVEGLLERTGLTRDCLTQRPHELSGGQCQRVAIARALAPEPRLLICDEILMGLDVIHQHRILELLQTLQKELNLTFLFISHDLSAVRFFCQRVAVIRNGKVLEEADADALFQSPSHPYSVQLVQATLQPFLRP